MCFSAPWCARSPGLPPGSLSPGPTRGIPARAQSPRTSGRSLGSAPTAPPPSPNFLRTSRPAPLGASLRFPHELFSTARPNQRAPGPSPSEGWGRLRQPPARPSLLRWAPPGRVPARPSTAPTRSAVFLSPAQSSLLLPHTSPARSALGPAVRAAPLPRRGGVKARGRHTPSQPGQDPEAPEGPPTPATSLSAPVRRVPHKDAPHPPARWGRGATPGRHRPVPCAPAWACAETPTESLARGIQVYLLRGDSDLGGLAPPKLKSDPAGVRRRHGAPGSALLGFTRSGFRR